MNISYSTVIPQQPLQYSSFPTATMFEDKVIIFYRQATKDLQGGHGTQGHIRRFEIALEKFIDSFNDQNSQPLLDSGIDTAVFQSDNQQINEMDCIISQLSPESYAIITRYYDADKRGGAHISLEPSPIFATREKIHVPNLAKFVVYGKMLTTSNGFYFTAYGASNIDDYPYPVVIRTQDFLTYRLHATLPHPGTDYWLNESSLIFDGTTYHIFIREDRPEKGIWHATSPDLKTWSEPTKILDAAQAPMTFMWNDEVYVTYRDWSDPHAPALSIFKPFDKAFKPTVIETYKGNPYDGAYSDTVIIDNIPYIIYYLGNELAEPCIRACKLDI